MHSENAPASSTAPIFERTLKFLEGLSPAALFVPLAALTGISAFVDYIIGTDTTLTVIYMFPIGIAAWFLGTRIAYGFAVVSSVLGVGGDILGGAYYSTSLVPVWNVASRCAIFVLAVELIVALRDLHYDLEARAEERAAKLTSEIEARERLELELLNISEREQRRVGHDIHDSLCQYLTGTALAGQVLAHNLISQNSPQAGNAARVVELIESSITLARNLASGLNTVRLSTDGLMESLESYAASTCDLFKISCRFECPLPVPVNDTETAEHLYRIAQEAVNNAIKHGQSKNVLIRLDASEDGILLEIVDDGKGLPPAPLMGKGMGLRIMSYRAERIGAQFSIRRHDKVGTIVSCLLPGDRETETLS